MVRSRLEAGDVGGSDGNDVQWVALPRFTGRAWVFLHNLAAETILPPRAVGLAPEKSRTLLFADLDEGIAADIAAGDVLVGGENFGLGPGAAAAVAALAAAGVSVTLARSFAPDFADAALAAGIPALVLDAPEGIRTGHTVRVDIDGGRVVDLSSGDRFPIRNLSDELLARLRERLGIR
jgi:3-isopropylmalate/(R)-2-methylmalate dehydratase small subunit